MYNSFFFHTIIQGKYSFSLQVRNTRMMKVEFHFLYFIFKFNHTFGLLCAIIKILSFNEATVWESPFFFKRRDVINDSYIKVLTTNINRVVDFTKTNNSVWYYYHQISYNCGVKTIIWLCGWHNTNNQLSFFVWKSDKSLIM